MKNTRLVSSFAAAAVEVAQGLFDNVQAFASLVGTNPAIHKIVGKIKKAIVIQVNGAAVQPDRVHGVHATFGLVHI